eukprot:GHUV01038270.1.p1 GENE.GHUV01038270.1~~GHUV01038270.1.p1  ORF type:complete len:163 (-),score=23.50 GHUV01038270.1:201-689(-)
MLCPLVVVKCLQEQRANNAVKDLKTICLQWRSRCRSYGQVARTGSLNHLLSRCAAVCCTLRQLQIPGLKQTVGTCITDPKLWPEEKALRRRRCPAAELHDAAAERVPTVRRNLRLHSFAASLPSLTGFVLFIDLLLKAAMRTVRSLACTRSCGLQKPRPVHE